MSEIIDWDIVAANNNQPPPDGWPENMQYPAVNNCAREMMAAEARDLGDRNGTQSTTGTAPAYALASLRSITSLSDGLIMGFKAHAGNSGAATTLNLNSLGAVSVVLPDGSQPLFVVGSVYLVVYDAAQARWQLLSATTPEDEYPATQTWSGANTLTAAELKGVIIRWAGLGGVVSVPEAVRTASGRARFITQGGTFDLTNNTLRSIYRTDSATPIAVGATVTLSGEAYTLLPGTFGMVLSDFLA